MSHSLLGDPQGSVARIPPFREAQPAPVVAKAPPPAPATPQPRPFGSAGFRSTEFWFALGCSAAGIGLCVVGLVRADDVLSLSGAALVGASTFAYVHARGRAKGRPYLAPGKL